MKPATLPALCVCLALTSIGFTAVASADERADKPKPSSENKVEKGAPEKKGDKSAPEKKPEKPAAEKKPASADAKSDPGDKSAKSADEKPVDPATAHAEIAELKNKLRELFSKEHNFRRPGMPEKERDELRREIGETERKLHELHGRMRPHVGPFGAPGRFEGFHHAGREGFVRLFHLRIAADNLRAAGMNELAEQVQGEIKQEEAKHPQGPHFRKPEGGPGPFGRGPFGPPAAARPAAGNVPSHSKELPPLSGAAHPGDKKPSGDAEKPDGPGLPKQISELQKEVERLSDEIVKLRKHLGIDGKP